MAGPETAPGAEAPAGNLGKPRGSKSRGSEPGPGWAHNPKGFVIHLDGEIIHPFCQETMRVNEAGEPIACGEETKVRPHPLERRNGLQLRKTPEHDGGLCQAPRGNGKPGSRGDETNPPGCPELPVGTGSSGSRRAPRPHRTAPAGTGRTSQLLVWREAQAERARAHRVGGRETHRRTLVEEKVGPHRTSREELIRRP